MIVRTLLEKLGVIEPEDELMAEHRSVRMIAEEVNEAARREIHASRDRRTLLQLRLDHIQRGRQR